MKLPSNKQVMRFFTPELLRQFSSDDDEEADLADDLWEQATKDYSAHLDAIRERMRVSVWRLTNLNLHDAEFLGGSTLHQSGLLAAEPFFPFVLVAVLTLKQHETIHTLIYSLWDEVREYPCDTEWPFSKSRRHWLYEEVDIHPDRSGSFLQRILCSDGSILEIPFTSVLISSVSLIPDAVTTS